MRPITQHPPVKLLVASVTPPERPAGFLNKNFSANTIILADSNSCNMEVPYPLLTCHREQLSSFQSSIQAMFSARYSNCQIYGKRQKICVLCLTINGNRCTGVSYSQVSSLTALTLATGRLP